MQTLLWRPLTFWDPDQIAYINRFGSYEILNIDPELNKEFHNKMQEIWEKEEEKERLENEIEDDYLEMQSYFGQKCWLNKSMVRDEMIDFYNYNFKKLW
jgi:hypothetical protein